MLVSRSIVSRRLLSAAGGGGGGRPLRSGTAVAGAAAGKGAAGSEGGGCGGGGWRRPTGATSPNATGRALHSDTSPFSSLAISSALPQDDDYDDDSLLMQEIGDANRRYEGRVVIRKTAADDIGWGVFAAREYAVGEFVYRANAVEAATAENTSHSVQVGWDRHVEIDLPARFANHGCNDAANVGAKPNGDGAAGGGGGAYDWYAVRPIAEGDELLFDYCTTEYRIDGFDACRCNSARCRGEKIRFGFAGNREDVLASFGDGGYVAPYLLTDPPPPPTSSSSSKWQ